MTDTINEKIARWKQAADIFLKQNLSVYVKEISNEFYFGHILFVGEESITLQCFGPSFKNGKKFTLYWPLIVDFDKYQEREVVV